MYDISYSELENNKTRQKSKIEIVYKRTTSGQWDYMQDDLYSPTTALTWNNNIRKVQDNVRQ